MRTGFNSPRTKRAQTLPSKQNRTHTRTLAGRQEIPPLNRHIVHLLHIWLQMKQEGGERRESGDKTCFHRLLCRQKASYIQLATVGTITKI